MALNPRLGHSLGGDSELFRRQGTFDEFGEGEGGAPAPHESESLWTLSQLSSTVRHDVGNVGPSDVCDDGCRDEAQASRIQFDGERTQAEVDQLCEENWSSNPIEVLVGELRSLLHSTGPIRRVRWLLCLHLVRRADAGYIDGSVDPYYVTLIYSLHKRLQYVEGVDCRQAMCDCVFDEVPASELSIAPRTAPRVDFEPLPEDVRIAAAECAAPTDQHPSAPFDYSVDLQSAQPSFTPAPSTYTPSLWSAPVFTLPKPRQHTLPYLPSAAQSRAHSERLQPAPSGSRSLRTPDPSNAPSSKSIPSTAILAHGSAPSGDSIPSVPSALPHSILPSSSMAPSSSRLPSSTIAPSSAAVPSSLTFPLTAAPLVARPPSGGAVSSLTSSAPYVAGSSRASAPLVAAAASAASVATAWRVPGGPTGAVSKPPAAPSHTVPGVGTSVYDPTTSRAVARSAFADPTGGVGPPFAVASSSITAFALSRGQQPPQSRVRKRSPLAQNRLPAPYTAGPTVVPRVPSHLDRPPSSIHSSSYSPSSQNAPQAYSQVHTLRTQQPVHSRAPPVPASAYAVPPYPPAPPYLSSISTPTSATGPLRYFRR